MKAVAILDQHSRRGGANTAYVQPRHGAIEAFSENHRVRRVRLLFAAVARVALEHVRADDDVDTVFNQEIVRERRPPGVAIDRHSAGMIKMDIDLNVAEDIPR